jgi:hypothetical protein
MSNTMQHPALTQWDMGDDEVLADIIAHMRFWIEDCDEPIQGRSDWEIVDAIEQNYVGGVRQFLIDG